MLIRETYEMKKQQTDLDVVALAQKVRRHVVNMTSSGNSSHVGSALSIADIVSVLYGQVMNVDSKVPGLSERDRFILSKGHAGTAVYAVLAEIGFFPVADLKHHYQNGSIFSGHISHKGVPGVELSTGSLGHGLGVGVGIAKAAKLKGATYKTYVLLSDGELDEGSNWEAFLFAAHHRLNNLVAIIDYNKLQSLDTVDNTLSLEPLVEKLAAFNWAVEEVDGHCHRIKRLQLVIIDNSDQVVCHTIKGKGVSFMENQVLWHYRSPQGSELTDALRELGAADNPVE